MPKGDPTKLVFIEIAPDITKTLIKIDPDMTPFVRKDGSLIAELNIIIYYPAAPYLFDIADNSMPLSDSLRVIFHSVVAYDIFYHTCLVNGDVRWK